MSAFFLLVVAAGIVFGYVVFALRRKKRLSPEAIKRLRKHWIAAKKIGEPSLRVLEAEKVLDGLLKELGYDGGFGEKLKRAGPRLRNEDAVWKAHKLRNRIAHEPGVRVTEAEAERALSAFERELLPFCGGFATLES